MAKKATPEELEAAKRLDEALAAEEAAANGGQEAAAATPDAAGNQPEEQVALQPTEPSSEPPKRKRGRPSNAEAALRETLGAPADAPASGGAKRGPKPKSGKSSDPAVLAKSIAGIHQLGAMLLQIPELQLQEEEAKGLADAVTAVCEEYGLSIDGKTGAAMQLLGAAAMVYGPRYFHFKMRIAKQRAEAEQAHGQSHASGY